MNTYQYRGFEVGGRARRGLVGAASIKEAREKLADQDVLAESLELTGHRLRFRTGARAVVYRELGALLAAGLPLVKALDILIDSPDTDEVRMVLSGVRDRVGEGVSLAEAFAEASRSVTAFETAIIRAAEQSAAMESMLEQLADFLEEQEQLRERIQGALIYPCVVVAFGLCIAILMLGLLLPQAQKMLVGTADKLPWLTRAMIDLGRVALWVGVPLIAAAVGSLLYARHRARGVPQARQAMDRRLFRWPIIGAGRTLLVNERFARTMAILLRGGVSVVDSFVLAGHATGSPWVEHLAELEAEAIRHGRRVSESLRRIAPLARSLPGWVQVGEAGGGLEGLLARAGQRYHDQWERFVTSRLSLIEPVLILAIGGFVLLVTLSILLPLLSLTQSLTS